MLKECTCTSLLLAIILAYSTRQKEDWKMIGREVRDNNISSMKSSNEIGKLASFNEAPASFSPAPFGRYKENINGVVLDLVKVPQGSFLMGNDRSPNPEEKPAHQVSLRSFYIGQYEINRKQWNIVVDTLPRVNRDLRRQYIGPGFSWDFEETTPADVVSWDDAVEFCDRLTRFTGKKYRLPSEAEWEYACRAGTQTEFSFGDEVNYNLAHFRNIAAAYSPSYWLLPVGTKGYANAWGLYDMHGNVAEWCLDVKHSDYLGAPTDGSPWTQGGDQSRRSQRGGTYGFRSEFGRSSARSFWSRNIGSSDFGFRVVAEVNAVIGSDPLVAASAASYSESPLALESIAALFGNNLSVFTQAAPATPLPISLAQTSIFIKDSTGQELLAPLFFVSPTQINFQLPPGLASGAATIYAVKEGNIHSTGQIEIASVAPGLFTADASGHGLAAAQVLRIRANGEQVYEPVTTFDPTINRLVAVPIDLSDPAEEVFLILFGTGLRHRHAPANVTAQVGGVNVEVLFVGAQGDFIGLDQVNLRLPHVLAAGGEQSVTLVADGKLSNTVKVHIK